MGVKYHSETIDGQIYMLVIEENVSDLDQELFTALSNLSKKKNHILLNLLDVKQAGAKLFAALTEISDRTTIKIISTVDTIISNAQQCGISTFPSVKSAALSFAGDETIRMMTTKMGDVPILNTEAYKLIQYVSQPDATFPRLESLIKENAGLCGQIFRLANSSYFKRNSKAETLQQSLVTLGLATVRQLLVYNFYNSVGNIFQAQKQVVLHGRQCAQLAEFICQAAGGNADECQKIRMSGLLHDIGQQALAFFFPNQYEKVYQIIRNEKKPSYLAEILVFGTEHQTVGSLLAKKWNFPPYLASVIGDHHYLQNQNWNTLTLPVYCANSFLNERDKNPFTPYFQRLEGYFFLKKKELPWKDPVAEFNKFLESHEDPFA